MVYRNREERSKAIEALAVELELSVSTVKRRKMVDKSLESVKKREESAENARKHREKCEKLAKMVVNRQMRAKEACEELGLSPRQFARWIAKFKESEDD